ncbi:hypothetical protein [Daejeonella sp. H1SJ63]|uniref:hypothetical protein n=1 Tax=Daejeonella sp. H1SJ63 TaxID=3034145 RepID=UPI0023EDE4C6|nr:hypothetical protein [Daejeonella sp. H1SJ63]
MKNQITVYNKMLPEFKRQAIQLIVEKLPAHRRAGQIAINNFLQKENSCLNRWHIALILGFLSIAEFGHLFGVLKDAFSLKDLKGRVSPEKILELTRLLIRLFKSLMIKSSGASQNEEEDQTSNTEDELEEN